MSFNSQEIPRFRYKQKVYYCVTRVYDRLFLLYEVLHMHNTGRVL
jgi:hypothetical protein